MKSLVACLFVPILVVSGVLIGQTMEKPPQRITRVVTTSTDPRIEQRITALEAETAALRTRLEEVANIPVGMSGEEVRALVESITGPGPNPCPPEGCDGDPKA